jgi:glutamine synthetase
VINFSQRCGVHDEAREQALQRVLANIAGSGLELVRFVWCDQHGITRGKTLVASAAERAMREGIGMVSTLMLKDTSDRTAFKVFERGGVDELPGFGQANNLVLLPDPASFHILPWALASGWMQCQPWFQDATPVTLDTRRVLQQALARLAERGLAMCCGLEVEFHIYRIENARAQLDPKLAEWPGVAPELSLIHPGYNLLSEAWYDMAEEPLRLVQHTAQSLGLPLSSLEIELGPSQVEAVFDVTDALTAADNMVLFRNATRQVLRRAGYHASFMCRPPFANIMSSGWHLHQSFVDLNSGENLLRRVLPAADSTTRDAQNTLSPLGEYFLAGLLEHAAGASVFCTPTANGYGRFRPNALAPQAILWGRDNRGAMLRVIGECGDPATRIENRIGEPAANPYLYLASQIYAGLDGIERRLRAPRATDDPYSSQAARLPTSLGEALDALQADHSLVAAFGAAFVNYFSRIKLSEWSRFQAATDASEFSQREYFSRI